MKIKVLEAGETATRIWASVGPYSLILADYPFQFDVGKVRGDPNSLIAVAGLNRRVAQIPSDLVFEERDCERWFGVPQIKQVLQGALPDFRKEGKLVRIAYALYEDVSAIAIQWPFDFDMDRLGLVGTGGYLVISPQVMQAYLISGRPGGYLSHDYVRQHFDIGPDKLVYFTQLIAEMTGRFT